MRAASSGNRDTRSAAGSTWGWFLGADVLALALLAWSGHQTRGLPEYARLAFLLVILLTVTGVPGLWADRDGWAPGVLLSSILVIAGSELSAPAAGPRSWAVWIVWTGIVAGILLFSRMRAGPNSGLAARAGPASACRVPRTVLFTAAGVSLGVGALSLGASALPGMAGPGTSLLQWVLYPVLLFGSTCVMRGASFRHVRWMAGAVALVVSAVCLSGGVRVARAVETLLRAERMACAASDGECGVLSERLRTVEGWAAALGWSALRDRAREDRVRLLLAHGAAHRAWRLLGIDPVQGVVIPAEQWEGPAGGFLFRNASCWTDVWLVEGTVQVEVRATGRPARGRWPELAVTLDGRELGRMKTSSPAGDVETFTTRVRTGKHRLRVSLVEGFWSSRGEQRSARLDTVCVRYVEGER